MDKIDNFEYVAPDILIDFTDEDLEDVDINNGISNTIKNPYRLRLICKRSKDRCDRIINKYGDFIISEIERINQEELNNDDKYFEKLKIEYDEILKMEWDEF